MSHARDLTVPCVAYRNWQEFLHLVYAAQKQIKDLLEVTLLQQRLQHLTENNPVSLFECDALALQKQVCAIMLLLLKQNETTCMQNNVHDVVQWCDFVAGILCQRSIRASQIYSSAFLRSTTPMDLQNVVDIMHEEIILCLSGVQPLSMHSMQTGILASLLHKNFQILDTCTMEYFSLLAVKEYLLAICMGMHNRVGANCVYYDINPDILRMICAFLFIPDPRKHSLCFAHAQWLY